MTEASIDRSGTSSRLPIGNVRPGLKRQNDAEGQPARRLRWSPTVFEECPGGLCGYPVDPGDRDPGLRLRSSYARFTPPPGNPPPCERRAARPSGDCETRTAPDEPRQQLRRLPVGKLLDRCSRLRRTSAAADELATRIVLRSLARRIQAATVEANELERKILAHVRALAPALLDEPGVGPIVAAQLIVAWSHPGRVRSEAAFARLAGVAPVPASSGQTQRHRLSRGGDRQLNRALHTIVLHRRQHDPQTKDYIEKRIAEGKSRRDATRPLK